MVAPQDTTHECPAPGCEARVAFEMLACRQHWFRVQPRLRGRLYQEWREQPGSQSYFRVRAEALRQLGVPAGEIAGMNGGVGLP